MTSCFEFNDNDNETNEEENSKKTLPRKRGDKVLTILEALLVYMGWQQIFYLPGTTCEQIVAAIHHAKLYADKVKNIPFMSSPTQCVTCNTAVTFTDDDLLLGSKPHNCLLFVTRHIQGQMVNEILMDGGSAVNIMPKSTMNDLGITI